MSNSRKRLIKSSDIKETSNHTEILSDDELDIDQYRYKPNNTKGNGTHKQQQPSKQHQPAQQIQTPKISDMSQSQQSQKNSVQRNDAPSSQKASAQRQSNLFQFFGKSVQINPQSKISQKHSFDKIVDVDEINIQEQIEIERKIREQQQQKQQMQQKTQQSQSLKNQQQFQQGSINSKIDVEDEDYEIIQQLKQVGLNTNKNTKNNYQAQQIATGVTKNYEIQKEQQQNKEKKGGISIKWNKSKPTQQYPEQQKKETVKDSNQSNVQNDPDLLKGKTIVLSGLLSVCSREKFEQFLKDNGAKVTTSVSGKTTFLILGDKLEDGRKGEEGQKCQTAKQKKTTIVKEDDLDDWCKKYIGVGLEDIFSDTSISKLYKASGVKIIVQTDQLQQSNSKSLADKYMPQCLQELVGNKSSATQLNDWIHKFQNPNSVNKEKDESKKKKKKFIPMKMGRFQPVGDLSSKACLISGPPGIGKSTMVRLVAEALGLKLIINNASDKRNKSSLRTILNDLVDNSVLMNLFRPNKNFLILMDEVDGMTGSDRGGISALIECIKSTRVPIVCICNDNDSQKLTSLLAQCFNIKFQKPEAKQIALRLKFIADQENINMTLEDLEKMAECFDCDVRQCINMLELQGTSQKSKLLQPLSFKKDKVCVFNTFNAAQTLLNKEQRKNLSLRDMMDMFFLDYDLIPLIVQDNFIKSQHQDIGHIAKAAELIAEGDIFSKKIRKDQRWSLMPAFGFLSSVYPSTLVGDTMEFPKFPTWLGKNSTASKIRREGAVIKNRIAPFTYLTSDINLYSKYIFKLIKAYLELKIIRNDRDAVWEVVCILENYRISPEELKDNLADQVFNPLKDNLMASINPQIKASLTKMYNKRHLISKEKKSKKQGAATRQISENYNPIIGEEAPLIEQQSQSEEEKKDEEEKQPKKKNDKKPTKKQSKKQTKGKPKLSDSVISEGRSQDDQSSGSLGGFIVDDEDD